LCANAIVDDGDPARIMKVMMTVTGTGTIVGLRSGKAA
jgi:hypothetical protein